MSVIRDLLTEVKDIFGSKYLHFGSDKMEEAEGCYQEAGQGSPDYASFETLRWRRSWQSWTLNKFFAGILQMAPPPNAPDISRTIG